MRSKWGVPGVVFLVSGGGPASARDSVRWWRSGGDIGGRGGDRLRGAKREDETRPDELEERRQGTGDRAGTRTKDTR
eukprot:768346-Hanusia_phi.AAC.7